MSPDGPDRQLRVVLADDQAMIRSGFAMILGSQPGLAVIGEADNGAAAVDAVAELVPDVVLMDVQMPVMDGIEATRKIVASGSPTKVIILTTFDRDDYLFEGLTAGASGFLLKNAEAEQLIQAVFAVGEGHALLAPEVTRRVISSMVTEGPPASLGAATEPGQSGRSPDADAMSTQLARLTEREREVLIELAHGKSNAEIAADLFVGEATVKTHVSSVLAKLHLRDRVQAVVFAYQAGLVVWPT